jgi:HEAT repeat protein
MGSQAKETVPSLIQILKKDNNPDVRVAAAYSLGDIGSTNAVAALIEAVKDKGFNKMFDGLIALLVVSPGYMDDESSECLALLTSLYSILHRYGSGEIDTSQLKPLTEEGLDVKFLAAAAKEEPDHGDLAIFLQAFKAKESGLLRLLSMTFFKTLRLPM